MTIKFIPVETSLEAAPTGLFTESYVASNTTYFWWKWATPAPVYSICLVKVIQINPNGHIHVRCFNNEGELLAPVIELQLDDWDAVWKTSPSTVHTLPSSTSGLGAANCAVLCIAEKLLEKTGLQDKKVEFGKYPYAEDATDYAVLARENLHLKATAARLQLENNLLRAAADEMRLHITDAIRDDLPSYKRLRDHFKQLY